MMKRKKAKKRLAGLWKKMKQHFKNFTATENEEELHKFRVQVKKIRSFLTLLESNKQNGKLLKTFKPVKKIFKSAGIARDAYLHQQQGKEHHIHLPRWYERQASVHNRETKKLIDKQQAYLHKMKRVKKKLRKQLHTISANEMERFYKHQTRETEGLLSHPVFTERLHNSRKMLKHILYNQSILSHKTEMNLQLNFSYIDDLQHTLGEWHDNKLALSLFKNKLTTDDLHSMQTQKQQLEQTIREKANDFGKKIKAKM